MAAKKSVNLFINAISVFNQDRYKDQAAVAARFANLTESDVVVSNLTVDAETDVVSASIKSGTRSFQGDAQTFKRAKFQHPKVLAFTAKTLDGVTDQASFLDAIKHIDTAGVYQVAVPELNGDTAILIVHAPIDESTPSEGVEQATGDAVFAILNPALLYTFDENLTTRATVGSTFKFSDDYLSDVVYHAPVGSAMLVVPATDYGQLDDDKYEPTM